MRSPAKLYKPDGAFYTGSRFDIVYPERMMLRPVSGRGNKGLREATKKLEAAHEHHDQHRHDGQGKP
jgi:hypothetical protein